MAITLYDVSVANYLQTLSAVDQYLQKGLAHCQETNIPADDVLGRRLFEDMMPFQYQVHSVTHHAVGAIAALRSGVFRPGGTNRNDDYAALQALVTQSCDSLRAVSPAEINDREGAEVVVEAGNVRTAFTAVNFILSFSLPNFYLHAVAVFDILRSYDVPFRKRDFIGATRMKK